MPRSFLNLRRGPGPAGLAVDPEGNEIADEAQLRSHLLQVVRKVRRTRSHAVRDWMTCSFEVTDEQGRRVLTVPLSDAVPDVLDGGPARLTGCPDPARRPGPHASARPGAGPSGTTPVGFTARRAW